jgi:hypothetical protein
MSKKFQLQIPKPCHENWDKMTPDQKGKFCSSCQKQVVDFSQMSDREVTMFFKKPSTGSVCGRFMNDQLNRELEIPRKRIPWVKYFFQFLLPGFLISLKSSAQEDGKSVKKIRIKNNYSSTDQKSISIEKCYTLGEIILPDSIRLGKFNTINQSPEIIMPQPENDSSIIRGRIIDEHGVPISAVSIMMKNTYRGAVSDASGIYKIKPHQDWREITLVISAVGYQTQEITVKRSQSDTAVDVQMVVMEHYFLGEVVVTRIGRRKKEDKVDTQNLVLPTSTPSSKNKLKLYPNPNQSNSTLYLEWKHNQAGYYYLQLFNASGQSIFNKEVWIDVGSKLLSVDLPTLKTGNYFVSLTNQKTSKVYTSELLIQ